MTIEIRRVDRSKKKKLSPSNNDMRRLMRKAGTKRVTAQTTSDAQKVLIAFVTDLIKEALSYTSLAKRNTVIASDVIHAMKRKYKTAMYSPYA